MLDIVVVCWVLLWFGCLQIYALNSFVSAVFRSLTLYVDVLRDVYEAYALYNFFQLLIQLAGGPDILLDKLEKVATIQYAKQALLWAHRPITNTHNTHNTPHTTHHTPLIASNVHNITDE